MHLVGDRFSLPRNILAPFTAGSNEVFLFSRWGIWADGAIPVELGNLPNLTSLLLFGNELSGCIPQTLWYVRNLEHRDLHQLGLGYCD